MLMTGAQYIESLRKMKTRVYMFGEEVKDWVDHPIIRPVSYTHLDVYKRQI